MDIIPCLDNNLKAMFSLILSTIIIFDDGCKVENEVVQGISIPRVVSPEECPDKEFVRYLNCDDIIHQQVRKECL